MKKLEFRVTPDEVFLTKDVVVNAGEYNVTECSFNFSEEYDGLIKKAVFFVIDKEVKIPINSDNKCFIPIEATKFSNVEIEIGVCAYELGDDKKLKLIYSPKPAKKQIEEGSNTNNDKNLSSEEMTDIRLSSLEQFVKEIAEYIMSFEKPHVHDYNCKSISRQYVDNNYHKMRKAYKCSICNHETTSQEELEEHKPIDKIWYAKDKEKDMTKCRVCDGLIEIGPHTHRYNSYKIEDKIVYTCECGYCYTECDHTLEDTEDEIIDGKTYSVKTCTKCGYKDLTEKTQNENQETEDTTITDAEKEAG